MWQLLLLLNYFWSPPVDWECVPRSKQIDEVRITQKAEARNHCIDRNVLLSFWSSGFFNLNTLSCWSLLSEERPWPQRQYLWGVCVWERECVFWFFWRQPSGVIQRLRWLRGVVATEEEKNTAVGGGWAPSLCRGDSWLAVSKLDFYSSTNVTAAASECHRRSPSYVGLSSRVSSNDNLFCVVRDDVCTDHPFLGLFEISIICVYKYVIICIWLPHDRQLDALNIYSVQRCAHLLCLVPCDTDST